MAKKFTKLTTGSSDGGEKLYLHEYYAYFNLSGGTASAEGKIYFLNNNPTAYGSLSSIPPKERLTAIRFELTNSAYNVLPIVFGAKLNENDTNLFCKYYKSTTSWASGDFSFLQWDSDYVYDMSGNLVDSNASGH